MEKKDRMLAILYTVLTGGYVSVPELAKEYQVSSKSIFRDISAVRQFLADNRELVGNVELEYNSREKCYRLTRENGLQDGKTVERKLYPVATSFSEYYFYLTAYRSDSDNPEAVYYRIDRIKKMEELEEKIPLEIRECYGKGTAKMYAQNMFIGERMKIRFLYTGPSVQAVLDKFPTAQLIRQCGGEAEISAMVEYSRGTVMELLSQGSWIRVLSPDRLVEDIRNEVGKMHVFYRE